MARFTSLIYSQIRGSVGGLTYTKNQFQGLIVKPRVPPTNPRTNYQTAIRSAFSGASQMWIDATDTVRLAWEAYADTLEYHGPLGTYKLPGRQVFVGIIAAALYNKQRGLTIAAVTDAAPIEEGFLELSDVHTDVISAAGTGFSIHATAVGTEGLIAATQISGSFNPTRNRFGGPFVAETLDEIDLSAAPVAAFVDYGSLVVDKVYFAQIRAISAAPPFRMSPYYILRCVATTVI